MTRNLAVADKPLDAFQDQSWFNCSGKHKRKRTYKQINNHKWTHEAQT